MFKKAPETLPKIPGSYFIRDFLIRGGMDVAFFTGETWNIGVRYELPKSTSLFWYDESEKVVTNDKLFTLEEVETVVNELVKIKKGKIQTLLNKNRNKKL